MILPASTLRVGQLGVTGYWIGIMEQGATQRPSPEGNIQGLHEPTGLKDRCNKQGATQRPSPEGNIQIGLHEPTGL